LFIGRLWTIWVRPTCKRRIRAEVCFNSRLHESRTTS